ncbi:hypothetical protein U3516DRAFT_903772 [Neocallimastix sp. 'constans']
MNIILSILIESFIFCIIFSLSLVLCTCGKRGIMAQIHNYPPIIIGHVSTFWEAWIHSYAILIIWNFYDAFILDCLIFCHTKIFVIPGTEDMVDEYHNYWFHIKYALISIPTMVIIAIIPARIIYGIIYLL